jgi:cobalt-zinc-cadmium efflux system membrane fusion protein
MAVDAASTPAATAARGLVLDTEAQKRGGISIGRATAATRGEATEAAGIVALNEARTARIGSLVDGIVMSVDVEPGARVKGQQQLASLHSHAVHDSWAGYRKARADERRLVTELRFTSDAEARAARLYADKAVSLQDLQRAEATRVSAEEALDIGRTELRRAEEELEHLGITNGDDPTGESGEQIPVRTPFAGVVLDRLVTQGTAVTTGMPMFVVSDLSTVWVLAELDEAHVALAQVGRPVTARVAAYPTEAFTGTVTYVGETVNPKTRRVTVRCEIPNTGGRLKPEMYATVEIGEASARSMVLVPSAAVQTVNGQPSVFISEADNRFRVQTVELGNERDGLIELRRGVREGDPVVTAGAFILKSELLKGAADAGE